MRVLIAEDSAITRDYLVHLLQADPAIQVVGTACDGAEAVALTERLRPDVVLMDIFMPRMNGYEATRTIMERVPTPIVLISAAYDEQASQMTFEALRAGALTVVPKPNGPLHPAQAEEAQRLRTTLKLLAEVQVVRRWPRPEAPAPPPPGLPAGAGALRRAARRVRLVAIGASTGGPAALVEVLGGLPAALPVPILLVQHIAPGFQRGFCAWLQQNTALTVKLAAPDERVAPGIVYIAPDGLHLGIGHTGRLRLVEGPEEDGFRPSISYLFRSVAAAYGAYAAGVLLTGMGRDGASGLLALRRAGGLTIVQDGASCVVFGMPAEALRLGAAETALAPAAIARTIRTLADRGGTDDHPRS